MAVSYVNAASNATSTSGTSVTVTMPTVQDSDYAVLVLSHSGVSTITMPTTYGTWTVANDMTVTGTVRGTIYTKFLTAAESGQTITITSSGAQRMGVGVAVYRGTSGIGVINNDPETTSTDTHSTVTVTAPSGTAVGGTAIIERSTTASTTFTAPSLYTLRTSAFGTGTGASSVGLADRVATVVASGGSIGGGNWVADVANQNAGTFTYGLVPSTSTALSGTLTLSPTSGTAPLSVTATAAFTGGTGTTKNYTFHWGDGTTTGPQTSNVATHTYTAPGNYTAAAGNPVYVDCVNT